MINNQRTDHPPPPTTTIETQISMGMDADWESWEVWARGASRGFCINGFLSVAGVEGGAGRRRGWRRRREKWEKPLFVIKGFIEVGLPRSAAPLNWLSVTAERRMSRRGEEEESRHGGGKAVAAYLSIHRLLVGETRWRRARRRRHGMQLKEQRKGTGEWRRRERAEGIFVLLEHLLIWFFFSTSKHDLL